MKKALLLLLTSAGSLAGCVTHIGDVAPTHTVEVAIKATNVTGACAAYMLVLKDAGQGATTVYSKNSIRGYESFSHEEKPVATGTTFTTEVGFYSANGQPVTLPTGTTLKASILVDGVVKKTVFISGATPVSSTGQRTASISTTL